MKINIGTDVPLPAGECPECHHAVDCASGVLVAETNKEHKPHPGDVMICYYCGSFLVFGDDLRLRSPTVQEVLEMQQAPYWPVIDRLQRTITAWHKSKP